MAWERKLMRTVRVQNDQVVGTLAHLITAIAEQGRNVGEIHVIKEGHHSVVREITVYAEDEVQLEHITHEMYLAAAQTFADMTPSGELVPSPLNKKFHQTVARAVAEKAVEQGLARAEYVPYLD